MRATRAATSVGLVVLAAGALGYAYGVDRERISDADRAERAGRVFPRFDAAEVTEVTIEQRGGRIVLQRSTSADAGGPAWTLRSPEVEAADPAAVDALLEDMNVAARLRDATIEPLAAGLGAPRASGTVRMGAVTYDFRLGAPAPLPSGSAYMALTPGSDRPFVADRLLVEDLLRGADAYRDRILVPFGAAETARVVLRDRQADHGGSVLVHAGGSSFVLDGAPGVRASRASVERLFAALGDAHADSFVHPPDGGSGPPEDAVSVTLLPRPSASRRQVVLRFAGACPGNPDDVAVDVGDPPGRIACVPKSALDGIRAAEGALADASLFEARTDEVAELRLESLGPGGAVLDLARRGVGWHERAPADRDLVGPDADAAATFVERLLGLRATTVRPPAQGAPFAAASKITVVRADGGTETVQVGRAAAGATVEVRRADDGATLVFPKEAAVDLETRSLPPRGP